jgi:hypothetical protein
MSDKVDTRVTLSLHPLNVTKIDGYSEATVVYLQPTERILREAYQGIAAVHDARAAARTDPTLGTEAAQLIKTDEMAQKVFARVAKAFDAEQVNLEKGIAHIEKELSGPVTAMAAHPVAAEIRSHVRGLPVAKRASFVQAAINSGDEVTGSSVLGAPSYLSGIDADMQKALLRLYREKMTPDAAARLKVMKGAKELLGNRGGLLITQLEAAVGAQSHVIRRLREAKGRSDKAFAAVPATA